MYLGEKNLSFTGENIHEQYFGSCENVTFDRCIINAVFYNCNTVTFNNCRIEFIHTPKTKNIVINKTPNPLGPHNVLLKVGNLAGRAIENLATHSHEIIADSMERYTLENHSGKLQRMMLDSARSLREHPRWSWEDFLITEPKEVWFQGENVFAEHPIILKYVQSIRSRRWGPNGEDMMSDKVHEPYDKSPAPEKYLAKPIRITENLERGTIEITPDEVQKLIDENEPENVFAIQEGLEKLINERRKDDTPLKIKLYSVDPFNFYFWWSENPDVWVDHFTKP